MPSFEHRGRRPVVDDSAYVAPTAVLCGDVHVGPQARVLFGAVLTAENGAVSVGRRTVVMEGALVRGRGEHPAVLADDVLVGPHAHVNGATIEDGCFIATGAAVFPGARLGSGAGTGAPGQGGFVHRRSSDSLEQLRCRTASFPAPAAGRPRPPVRSRPRACRGSGPVVGSPARRCR